LPEAYSTKVCALELPLILQDLAAAINTHSTAALQNRFSAAATAPLASQAGLRPQSYPIVCLPYLSACHSKMHTRLTGTNCCESRCGFMQPCSPAAISPVGLTCILIGDCGGCCQMYA
jgi:hypothetical protein